VNAFFYRERSSADYGIRIESKNVFSGPEAEMDFISIPGRHGDLLSGDVRFPNVQVVYSVFVPARSVEELESRMTAIKGWLYGGMGSYDTLSDTYDEAHYRDAVFSGKLDIEEELHRIGVFNISFTCKPFRRLTSGNEIITLTEGMFIPNPCEFDSQPQLVAFGSGSGSITVETREYHASWQLLDIDEHVVIDSERMMCYKGTENKNDTLIGDGFPVLKADVNYVSFSGGISELKITPRWWAL